MPAIADENSIHNDIDNIRGLVKPTTKAILSSQISARIIKIPFKDGDKFKQGQLLIKFDCDLYKADLASANAEYEAQLKRFDNNKQLLALNAISNIEVDISEAETKKAKAEVQIKNIRVSRCTIKAPYDGRVIEIIVNEHESVAVDQELISILNDKNLDIELIAPSKWLAWIKTGAEFSFLLDETEKEYKANVKQIGAVVDPVSQTIRLKGVFEETTDDVLSGMSGTARFNHVTE
jgi:RND family efflux transporter MFP subunit